MYQVYFPCICSHICPMKLTLIKHNVVAMTVDDASDIHVATKKLLTLKYGRFTHIFNPAAQNLCTVYRWAPRLVSASQYLTKCEIWS